MTSAWVTVKQKQECFSCTVQREKLVPSLSLEVWVKAGLHNLICLGGLGFSDHRKRRHGAITLVGASL